jgi:release factor glutamine methyltransferase
MSRLPLHEQKLIQETALELFPDDLVRQKKWIEEVSFKRLQSEPLQYLMGNQTFLNHRYKVGRGVLIPRPETEVLVDVALKKLPPPGNTVLRGIEIGLGSGAISIEILSERPDIEITATETSKRAISYAKENLKIILKDRASALKIYPVEDPETVFPFHHLHENEKFDFLISNPPYLSSDDPIEEDVLAHEPLVALFPKNRDPNYFYRSIANEAPDFLKPGAWIFLEVPHQRAEAILGFFSNSNFIDSELILDLTGRPRVLITKRRQTKWID